MAVSEFLDYARLTALLSAAVSLAFVLKRLLEVLDDDA